MVRETIRRGERAMDEEVMANRKAHQNAEYESMSRFGISTAEYLAY